VDVYVKAVFLAMSKAISDVNEEEAVLLGQLMYLAWAFLLKPGRRSLTTQPIDRSNSDCQCLE
jgi:hypothetical protein